MLVGIALAVYEPNVAFFKEQLDSILEQTFEEWICLLSFDSPIQSIQSQSEFDRVREDRRFIWHENAQRLGHKKNFESAIQKCLEFDVDAIACADQDDIWYKDKLAICMDSLSQLAPFSMVHSDMHVLEMDADGKASQLEQTVWQFEARSVARVKPEHLLVRNVVNGASMVFDAELARRYPSIPDGVRYHDHWYAFIASTHGGVHPIYEPLMAYRLHYANVVGLKRYRGFLRLPESMTVVDGLQRCRRGWLQSYFLARAGDQLKLRVPRWAKLMATTRFDFGFGFLLFGFRYMFTDRHFARKCFCNGVGKLYRMFAGLPDPEE